MASLAERTASPWTATSMRVELAVFIGVVTHGNEQ